jgi:hypothetical protein
MAQYWAERDHSYTRERTTSWTTAESAEVDYEDPSASHDNSQELTHRHRIVCINYKASFFRVAISARQALDSRCSHNAPEPSTVAQTTAHNGVQQN